MKPGSFRVAAALAALSLSQVYAGVPWSGPVTAAEGGRQKIEDLRYSAVGLENDADQLRMVIASPELSFKSHEIRLEALKADVNRMGREISLLERERSALPSWEQQAIAEALPLLKDSAANTTKAIEFFNENKSHLWAGNEYRDYAGRIFQDSQRMAKVLGNNLELAKLRQEEQQLSLSMTGASGM